MTMNEIKEHDYEFWRDHFNAAIEGYGENVRGVGGWDEITHIKYMELILTILGHISNKKILDVGGGYGLNTIELAKSNHVYNLDLSEGQLKRSIKHNLLPICGNAIALPFKNESFDYVLCIGGFQYIPHGDRMKLLNELYRVCKSDGLIFIETPNKAALVRKLLKIKSIIKNPFSLIFRRNHIQFLSNYVSLREFMSYLMKLKGLYEIYTIFLIYRPLKDFVTFTTKTDTANSLIAQWLCTDFVFVIRPLMEESYGGQ